MRYRIGIINDFKNNHSFVDYRKIGIDKTLELWDGCIAGGSHRGFQLASDRIWIFLNFEQVGNTVSREEARGIIRKLLDDAPVDLSDLAFYLEV